MGGVGVQELIIILVILLLLFGAKKLPDLAASMGKSIKEFRKASEEAEQEGGDGSARATGDAKASTDAQRPADTES